MASPCNSGASAAVSKSDLIEAITQGDLAAVQSYFAQPSVVRHVKAVETRFAIGDTGDAQPPPRYGMEDWYAGNDEFHSIFDHIQEARQLHVLSWFLAPSPTSITSSMVQTLAFLLEGIAVAMLMSEGEREFDHTNMDQANAMEGIELVLSSSIFQNQLTSAAQCDLLQVLLHCAAASTKHHVVAVIAAHGAIMNNCDDLGASLLTTAVLQSETPDAIVSALLERGEDALVEQDALGIACEWGHLGTIRILLANGADARRQSQQHEPPGQRQVRAPFHSAAIDGLHETVELLITSGFVDIDARDESGKTPLLAVVSNIKDGYMMHGEFFSDGCAEEDERLQSGVVEILLRYGANVHLRDHNQRTPLHAAMRAAHVRVIGLLLEYGSDPNACTADGATPLTLVATEGRSVNAIEVMRVLLNHGADMFQSAANGDTPYKRLKSHTLGQTLIAHFDQHYRKHEKDGKNECVEEGRSE